MASPSPEHLRRMAVAAEMRAGGRSWESVAARVRRSAAACRGWPKRYAPLWRQLYAAAVRTQFDQCQAEAAATLRSQLRLADTKETRDAAKALLTAAARNRRTKRKSRNSSESLEQFAGPMSNAQIEAILPPNEAGGAD